MVFPNKGLVVLGLVLCCFAGTLSARRASPPGSNVTSSKRDGKGNNKFKLRLV